MSLRRSSTITIVVVMLSSTADRKNVNMQSTHRSERFLRVVVMLSVRTVNLLRVCRQFDDRHGADQEEEGLRDVAQTLHYLDVENVIQSLAV